MTINALDTRINTLLLINIFFTFLRSSFLTYNFVKNYLGYVQLFTGNKIRQLLALLCFFGDRENNVKDGVRAFG